MSPVSEASIVGRVIDGRYRVLRHLADGGMGSVFVALDQRLDREVALKVMRADLARDNAFVARFRREARSAARLTHPNVVAVTDQGSDAHYAFLAMELVNGQTLRQVMRQGPMSVEDALALMDPILDGLAAAHRAGIVHRDVKPENVLISQSGQVKVTDFGLARAVTTSTLTGDSDILLGTASYLAPEQVEHGTADPRTDVYAAGLMLFELIAGEKAFPGDSPIHVAYQHVHSPMPRITDAVEGVPSSVETLIGEATAKDPDERPATAADFLISLRSVRRNLEHGDAAAPVESGRTWVQPAASPDPSSESDDHVLEGSHTSEIGHLTDPLNRHHYEGQEAVVIERPWAKILALLLIPLLLIGGGAAWAFTAGPFGSTTVPPISGLNQNDAIQKLRSSDLKARVVPAFSESVPSGRVVSSQPSKGADARKNSTVLLTVSKGPERFSTPKLQGSTETAARAAITKADLAVGTVTRAYDEKVPSGSVVSSSPSPGTPLKKGAKVNFVVSKGKEPISLPYVAGESKGAAESTLTSLGLKVTYGTPQFSDTVEKDNVISSNPAGGGTVYKGDSVQLVISKGPEMVTVPRVIDMKSSAAKRLLEAQGFNVKMDRFFGGLFDTVRDQSLRPGSSVKKGSTITLSIV